MKYYLLIIIFATITSCNNDDSNNDDCLELETAYATNITAPSAGAVDEALEIEVDFTLYNSCGNFSTFEEEINGNSRTVEIIAQYDVCAQCLQAIETVTVIYPFTASAAGGYELKFKSGPDEFIVVVITIE